MSRYGGRSSGGDDMAYGEYNNRWDRDRFDRSGRVPPAPPEPPRGFEDDFRFFERDSRGGRREVLVEDRQTSRGPRGRIDERDRIFRETYGDGARRRTDRELFGDVDPREIAEMAMTPYKSRGEEKEIDITIKESRKAARPGMLRRQSSLDTFDRRPIPRYDREEYRPPVYTPIPLPIRRRDDEREDDTYREVEVKRERSVHRRSSKPKSRATSVASSSSSSATEVEEIKSKVSRAPGFKKGRTKVPKRLVFKEAILDLGYPFTEDEHFFLLQVALEKEQIDEVIRVSETYKSGDGKHKSFRYEERVEEDESVSSVTKVEDIETKGRETIIRKEYINPPSDFLGTDVSRRSRHGRRDHSPSIESSISQRSRPRARSTFQEERMTIIEEGRARSRAPTTIIPGTKTIIEERVPGPLGALIIQERETRSDADIRAEILALESERRALRVERESDQQLILVREERPREVERERSPPRNVVRVEKDRKDRQRARLVAAAVATLT